MKLVIMTLVDAHKADMIRILKGANIFNYSEIDIAGFKNSETSGLHLNWFADKKIGADSELFFSFTEDEKVDSLLESIKAFNNSIESNSPIKAVVVPIERYV